MALKQLTAGIMVGVFALAFAGTELADASDKTKEEKRIESKSDAESAAAKEKPRKEERPSLWQTRQIIPAGPKY